MVFTKYLRSYLFDFFFFGGGKVIKLLIRILRQTLIFSGVLTSIALAGGDDVTVDVGFLGPESEARVLQPFTPAVPTHYKRRYYSNQHHGKENYDDDDCDVEATGLILNWEYFWTRGVHTSGDCYGELVSLPRER